MEGILIIRQPKTEDEYEAMYDLRWRVLREPWGQPRGTEKDDLESEAHHFIALLDDQVVGTARLHKIKENVGQIRYIAVEDRFRRKKIGWNLMEAIHVTARNRGTRFLILNAR